MHLHEVEARHAPIAARLLDLPLPRATLEIQTFSAEKRRRVAELSEPVADGPLCDPYIGEESIMRPPASKNAAITAAHSSSSSGSSPTLNVIQLPSPMTGKASPCLRNRLRDTAVP